MEFDQQGRQFRLLTVHCVVSSLAISLAGSFVGAYLLRLGFGLPATIAMYAVLLGIRLTVRAALLPVIRLLGMRRALVAGRIVMALQFLALIGADRPACLALWVLIVSVGECIYWPICHAANAVGGGHGRRGWQIALRQIASTGISVAGPLAGGMILTRLGPEAEFYLATALGLISAAPLFYMGRLDLGPVPTVQESLRVADPVGLLAFAGDGFMSAGLGIAWPMILFSSLGSSYEALGWASSVAAVAGALAGLACGMAIDRGHRGRLAHGVTIALLASVVMRAAAGWAPGAAVAANAVGAAVGGAYYPVLMSMIYDRAKRSGSAYRFHLGAEAGWDCGAILGCLSAAAVAWSGVPATLAVMPSVFGVLLIHRCVRVDCRPKAAQLVIGGAAVEAIGSAA
jgi:MFS transporter, DHA1 family, inner membrane transport protein